LLNFEWDARKDASNQRKHGVAFAEALSVFADARALTFDDIDHSDFEDRSFTFGRSSRGRLLVVVHTNRGDAIRLISARKATSNEKRIYEEG
jgi:uncharacterized DUF497 family protein